MPIVEIYMGDLVTSINVETTPLSTTTSVLCCTSISLGYTDFTNVPDIEAISHLPTTSPCPVQLLESFSAWRAW